MPSDATPALVTSPATPLICALLRGESPTWPAHGCAPTIAAFLHDVRYHGVAPLVDARLRAMDARTWPDALQRACHEDALMHAVQEYATRTELGRVLRALHQAGVSPLLLKGTALAYGQYPSPALRPRGDTDLLLPEAQVGCAATVLEQLGYARGSAVTGELISYQANWSRRAGVAIVHNLDVHWRINNSQMLAKLLTYDELDARAIPLPALDQHARGLTAVHALLLACIHRAGHTHAPYYVDGQSHLGGNRLIWLYDIHLLVTRMSGAELAEFVALATSRQLRTIGRDAIDTCIERFATPVPPSILAGLAHAGRSEPTARYLSGGHARQLVGDFIALDGMTQRARWLKELACPPANYMREKYPDTALRWLPALYARRALHGLWRLVAGRPVDHHQ